ncbi:Eco57I restriction-modification methylase domain-containing protein [Halobaculum sp. MBLA0143]|uniref:Eco57I restriction-modification methylase domain-containing protein n=1 Tax=Halobaculum sp. MBLA0143 TaxID=3079933 RepID=UPI003525152F
MTRQSPSYRTNRNLFSNHYLSNRLRETDQWTEPETAAVRDAYEEIRGLYEDRAHRVDDYSEAQLEEEFIKPVFDALGIQYNVQQTVSDVNRRPDYGFFETAAAADVAFDREDPYAEAVAVADAKFWGRKLDTRGDKLREFENPSYQIHVYLEETAASWAVLTNGRQWRLYYGPTSHRLDSYYEIDLPELLSRVAEGGEGSLEAFREFYLFFRHEAFVPDERGDCFLDDVYEQSNRFSEELGADLQDNIYEAIRVLAAGFLDTNDDLDRDDLDDETLDLIHDSSLIYLYRLIFVLYAESEERDLLPTDNEVYESQFSLNSRKETVAAELDATGTAYHDWQTRLWEELDDLFTLIDQGSEAMGIPPESLQVPAYNGGLFDTDPGADADEESRFLATHEVDDSHLARVIDLLSRQETGDGAGASPGAGTDAEAGAVGSPEKTFVDYSSLDVRQLGSIYEGLLEYELNLASEPKTLDDDGDSETYESAGADAADEEIVVEPGEVYLTTDSGERKSTGSYYTPEYVVEYIVEETLGPQVDAIREELLDEHVDATGDRGFAERFTEEILDLTVLDPAMGSGHFLVNAVDYLAREIIDAREKQDRQAVDDDRAEDIEITTDDGERRDINWARRQVAKQCLYGVDVNPLATELAKVSLWLRTLAAGKPLAFLDHHLKTGNSLVGSNIYEVLSNGDSGQATLDDFRAARTRTLSHVQGLMADLVDIENDDLASIKQMQATYEEMRSDPLYRRLFELANVHTAERFGLDVPDDAYRRMAGAIESEAEWNETVTGEDWFVSAQAMADEELFFHWELEFPEVFVNGDGRAGGFDAVIGNPPWGASISKPTKDYIAEQLSLNPSASDTFAAFTKLSGNLDCEDARFGMILPSGWQTSDKYAEFREWTVENYSLSKIVNLPYDVFSEAYVDTSIFVLDRQASRKTEGEVGVINYGRKERVNEIDNDEDGLEAVDYSRWFAEALDPEDEFEFISYLPPRELSVEEKVAERGVPLREIADVQRGITPFDLAKEPGQNRSPALDGDLRRYRYTFTGNSYVEYHEDIAEYKPERYFQGDRLILRELISRQFRLQLARTDQDFVTNKSYQSILLEDESYRLGYLLGVLNSKLLSFYHIKQSAVALRDDFPKIVLSETRSLPIPEITDEESSEISVDPSQVQFDSETEEIKLNGDTTVSVGTTQETQRVISELTTHLMDLRSNYEALNLDLESYLGEYRTGPTVDDLGFVQICEGKSLIKETTEQRPNLMAGRAVVNVESDNSVEIKISGRFKPDDDRDVETDQWGYTESKPIPALRITDLTQNEALLLKNFVPVAVDRGLSNFRKEAAKSISLVDRLLRLELPEMNDVRERVERYSEVAARGEELKTQIVGIDDLLDQIVYRLFGLSADEIAVVEDSIVTRKLTE